MPELVKLDPMDFYNADHRTLFRVMSDVWGETDDVDAVTILERLDNRGHDRLTRSLNTYMTFHPFGHIDQYLEIIKDRAARRRIIEGMGSLAQNLHDTETPLGQVIDEGVQVFEQQAPVPEREYQAEDGARAVLAKAHEYYSNPLSYGETRGINTGWTDLNVALGGWKRGYVYYVLGMQHSGKTWFCLNAAMNICERGGSAAVFSMEMNADTDDDPQKVTLWERVVLAQAQIDYRTYQSGHLSDDQYNRLLAAGDEVATWDLTMYDDVRTLAGMESAVRRLQRDRRLDLAVADYLGLIEQYRDYRSRNEEIGGLTSGLNRLGHRTQVPWLVPHQVSDKAIASRNNKRIQASDGYESGHLSKDAAVILGIYREDLWNPDAVPGLYEIDVLKDRIGGAGGASVDLLFTPHGRIRTYTTTQAPEPALVGDWYD
jgi:replicative DNA helicase